MYNKISIFYLPVLVSFIVNLDCSTLQASSHSSKLEAFNKSTSCITSEENYQLENTIISIQPSTSYNKTSNGKGDQKPKTFIEHYSEIAKDLVSPACPKSIVRNFGIGSLALEPYPDKADQSIEQTKTSRVEHSPNIQNISKSTKRGSRSLEKTEISSLESSPAIKILQKDLEPILGIEESDEDEVGYDPGPVFLVE